jgi:lipopolysaccharide export system protein LptA
MNLHHAPDMRRTTLVLLASLLLPACAFALPEDASKKVDVDFTNIDLFLDQGLVVYTGSTDKPACATQGSVRICGTEIRLENAEDGSLKKVTATGSPARFQQQPAADQELVHASGETLVYDNVAQLVTADENAEFSQAGYALSHQHIEYDISTRRASSSGDGQGRMTVTPAESGN